MANCRHKKREPKLPFLSVGKCIALKGSAIAVLEINIAFSTHNHHGNLVMAQPIAAEDVAVIDSTLAYGQCMSSPATNLPSETPQT